MSSQEAEFETPRRYPTDSSLFSCTDLEDDDPYRHLRAAEVRRQAQQAPDKRQRLPPPEGSTSNRKYLAKYPETCKNKPENFTNLQSKSPRREYPLVDEEGKNWVPRASGQAEKVRVVYNNNDRNTVDVVYHNEKKSKDTAANFSLANYRPSSRETKESILMDQERV